MNAMHPGYITLALTYVVGMFFLKIWPGYPDWVDYVIIGCGAAPSLLMLLFYG